MKININTNKSRYAIIPPACVAASVVEATLPTPTKPDKDKNFTIETIKWEWAADVKSKGVYRDDEFIRTNTKEEALQAAEFLLRKPKGLTYTITVFRDNQYFTYYRHSMPCLGGLVKYRDSHGEKYKMNPYFPRDIYVAFPEGEIIYIGMCAVRIKNNLKNPYYDFILSKESPWVAAFNNKDSIVFGDNWFILTDMNTDPTVFYSLMRLGGLRNNGYGVGTNQKDWNPKAIILLSKTIQADPRRLAGQKPIKTSGGNFIESWGYTRPLNESIFKFALPRKLKDFDGFPSNQYPPEVPHDNLYFLNTMKNKFGVDIQTNNHQSPKIHDALVEAWNYFKEESKQLDSGFPD